MKVWTIERECPGDCGNMHPWKLFATKEAALEFIEESGFLMCCDYESGEEPTADDEYEYVEVCAKEVYE